MPKDDTDSVESGCSSAIDLTDQALIEQAETEIDDYEYWNRSVSPTTFRELLTRFKRLTERDTDIIVMALAVIIGANA